MGRSGTGWVRWRAVPGRLMAGLAAVALAGSPAGAQGDEAAMFRGGPGHPGVYDGAVDRLGGEAWRFRTGGPVRSSPAVTSGTVYVGSADGRLYALDRRTGAERWRADAGSAVQSSPAVSGDRVYFTTRDNAIHAVDRRTGDPVWRVATGETLPFPWGYEGWDYILSSPVVVDGVVYAGSGDGGVYALDGATGRQLWRYRTGGRVRSSPAVVDGVAYVGSTDGWLYALDASSGEPRWRFETEGVSLNSADFGYDRRSITSSPAVVDGVVYIGSRDARTYAVDAATGRELWRVEEGSAWTISSPAVADGVIYSARSSSGNVRAIEAATGSELWMLEAGGAVHASAAVAGRLLFLGSQADDLLALDRETGEVRWRFRTGGPITSSATVAGGGVFFGSDDGHVYALAAAEGPAPARAVYWDDARMPWSVLGSQESHRAIVDHFEAWGYDRLDADALAAFMAARIADGAPSVVVFAMDDLPGTVAPAAEDTVLFRRYLEAGGKVVWPGWPPALYERDPATGERTGLDRERPTRLLGVDHSALNFDIFGVRITGDGRRWGLTADFMGRMGVDPDAADLVLGRDEQGLAVAWVEQYGGGPGTGFVRVPAGTDPARLEQLRAVAEYGVFRLAPDVW